MSASLRCPQANSSTQSRLSSSLLQAVVTLALLNPGLKFSLGNCAEKFIPLRTHRGNQIQRRLPQTQCTNKIPRPQSLGQCGYSRFLPKKQFLLINVEIPVWIRADAHSPLGLVGRDAFFNLVPCPAINKVRNRPVPHSGATVPVVSHSKNLVRKRESEPHEYAQSPGIVRLYEENVLLGNTDHFSNRLVWAAAMMKNGMGKDDMVAAIRQAYVFRVKIHSG